MITGGTLFSGIGAPECAAPGIDWRWAAEIDPFACAVHTARFPHIPNLGDITKVDWHAVEPVDLVVGGPPCQDYSVAGQRASLSGARGDLTLQYARIIDAIDPAWSVTENVPGWLSTGDNAFGAFLGILVGADAALVPARGQRWTDAGVVAGPRRTAAGSLGSGSPRSGKRLGRREAAANHLIAGTLPGMQTPNGHGFAGYACNQSVDAGHLVAFGGNNTAGPIDVAIACNAHGGPHGRLDFESETFVTHGWSIDEPAEGLCLADGAAALSEREVPSQPDHALPDRAVGHDAVAPSGEPDERRHGQAGLPGLVPLAALHSAELGQVAHSLRADGFDASEDGTGRGTPLIAITISNESHTLGAIAGTLSADGRGSCQPNPLTLAVAFHENQRAETYLSDVMHSLKCGGGKPGQGYPAIAIPLQHAEQLGREKRQNGMGLGNNGDPMYTLETRQAHGIAASLASIEKPQYNIRHADADETHAATLLRDLRQQVGTQAFAEWGSRILNSLQSPEVLRQALHGCGIRRAARESGACVDDGALPRAESLPAGAMRVLWEDGPDGRSPQGRQLAQQLARELGAPLPVLPHEVAPTMSVRRLLPVETERLQGFPDDWTAITHRGKPAADGPRYRAIGNSMAVPCIGRAGAGCGSGRRRIVAGGRSMKPAYTGRYKRSGFPPPPFSDDEIAAVRRMRAAGCSLKSIAAALGRSKAGVVRYVPTKSDDSPNTWDAPPPKAIVSGLDLEARWQARMPTLREAMRKAGAAPLRQAQDKP